MKKKMKDKKINVEKVEKEEELKKEEEKKGKKKRKVVGSWLHVQRSRVRFQALPDFLRSSESGTGSAQPREYT
jgi:hypothetical protein